MKKYSTSVYTFLKTIPAGKVTTYGSIAKKLFIPSPRIVGRILHENTDPATVPCHRVVFADGSLSKSYVFGGMEKQREKLLSEGVMFLRNRVILKECLIV